MTIWCMRIVHRMPKATNTHSENVTLLFHRNNDYTNVPQFYIIRTSPVLCGIALSFFSLLTCICGPNVGNR
jgi:hypothetical protein